MKNLNDDKLRINIKQDDIIIFYNNLTCYNCFLELNDYISKNRDNFKNIYCVIQNSRKTKYSERILLKGIKDIFKADNYFFDITNNDNLENSEIISNLFLVYHIDKTPAILYNKKFLKFYNYDDIFNKSTNIENFFKKLKDK